MDIISKIKFLRKTNNLSQKEFAEAIGTSGPDYSNFETGKIKLNLEYAKLLASFYEVPLSYILDSEKDCIYITKDEYIKIKEIEEIIKKIESRNKYSK